MNGLHLMADLYGCQCDPRTLRDRDTLEALCRGECVAAGLAVLGACFHQFRDDHGGKAGVTGTVVLAESHLAIHTWPETGSASLDVYVCNVSRDNSGRARRLFDGLREALDPRETVVREVLRGRGV